MTIIIIPRTAHEGQVREQTVTIIIIPRTAHEGQVKEQTVTIIIIPRTAHEGQVREQTVTIIIIPSHYTWRRVIEQTKTIIGMPRKDTRRTSQRTCKQRRSSLYPETTHEGQLCQRTKSDDCITPRNYKCRRSQRTNNNDHQYNLKTSHEVQDVCHLSVKRT